MRIYLHTLVLTCTELEQITATATIELPYGNLWRPAVRRGGYRHSAHGANFKRLVCRARIMAEAPVCPGSD